MRSKGSVLLVEDDSAAAAGVAWLLTDEGYQVQKIGTGREAFGLVLHTRPAVVIIDISLPDVNGLSIAALIRKHVPSIPIIVTSGYDRSAAIDELLRSGCAAYLQKPYEVAELIKTMERLLPKLN